MAEAIGALRWYLEIDGITEGIFREVTGLDSETEVIEHRVTGKGGNLIVQKIPGALKWSNITLRRGITDYTGVAELPWFSQIMTFGWQCVPLGQPVRENGRLLTGLHIHIDGRTIGLRFLGLG